MLFYQGDAGRRYAAELNVFLFVELKLSRVDLREIENVIDNAQQESTTLVNNGDVSLLLWVQPSGDAGCEHL